MPGRGSAISLPGMAREDRSLTPYLRLVVLEQMN